MINCLAISVGLLGGLCTWLFLATNAFLIWAAFVAWACFYHSGGDAAAFRSTVVSNLFGVVVAWAAGLAIASISPGAFGAAVIVGISIVIYILAAYVPALSSIPAVTYGYACTFAFLTQNAAAFTPAAMLSASSANALIIVPFSMIIGACFAFASSILAGTIQKILLRSSARATV